MFLFDRELAGKQSSVVVGDLENTAAGMTGQRFAVLLDDDALAGLDKRHERGVIREYREVTIRTAHRNALGLPVKRTSSRR